MIHIGWIGLGLFLIFLVAGVVFTVFTHIPYEDDE